MFRPRHDWTVTNAGPIIVRSGQFARHLATTTVLPHNIPCKFPVERLIFNGLGIELRNMDEVIT